jgi:glycosyltransferase involved in cell wall biosynthesis
MKVAFYNPYFDSLSGGERYVLTLASHWSKKHQVTIFWDDPSIVKISERRFNLDLSNIKVVENIFQHESFLSKLFTTSQYDVLFILSDGSIPTSCATNTILHFQVPFQKIKYPFWKKLKAPSIVCNSFFTKQHIDPLIGQNAEVIYPPVDVDQFSPSKKEKIILSVGRFSSYFQTKKQEILIEIFKKGIQNGFLKGWKLILTGGLLESDREYFSKLTRSIDGFSIELLPNVSFPELQNLYGESTIYWHAAGYGETNPQYMEHFGITTVESMAGGCIPVVFNAGGQPEIIQHKQNGYVWNTEDECLQYTKDIISKKYNIQLIQTKAMETAKKYSSDRFCKSYDSLLARIAKK